MNTNDMKSFLATTPCWLLALLTFVGTFILILVICQGVGFILIFAIGEELMGKIGEPLSYILYDLVTAACCFIIIKHKPISTWYIPIIYNLLGIISAIVEPIFWITSMWFYFCSGWVQSLIAFITGVQIGRIPAVSDKPQTN
jgi:hypothetical protein